MNKNKNFSYLTLSVLLVGLFSSKVSMADMSPIDINAKLGKASDLLPYLIYMPKGLYTGSQYPNVTLIRFGAQISDTLNKNTLFDYDHNFTITPAGNSNLNSYRNEDTLYREVYSKDIYEHNGSLSSMSHDRATVTIGNSNETIDVPIARPYNQEYLMQRYKNKGITYDTKLLDFPIVKINYPNMGVDGCLVGYLSGGNISWGEKKASIFSSNLGFTPISIKDHFPYMASLLSFNSFGEDLTYQSKIALGIFSGELLNLPKASAQPLYAQSLLPRVGQVRFVNLTAASNLSRIVKNIDNNVLQQTAYNLVEPDWLNGDSQNNRIDLYYVSAKEIKAERDSKNTKGWSLCDSF